MENRNSHSTVDGVHKQRRKIKMSRSNSRERGLEFGISGIWDTLSMLTRRGINFQPNSKLILLDLKMPRLGGIDVLRRLKSDQRTQTLPVVMLTSSAEEQDIAESYHLGVNSYLVKPVEFPAFVELVAQLGMYWAVMNRLPA